MAEVKHIIDEPKEDEHLIELRELNKNLESIAGSLKTLERWTRNNWNFSAATEKDDL